MPATKAVDQYLAHLPGLALIGIIVTMILCLPCFFSSLWPALPRKNWNLSCHSETTLFCGYYIYSSLRFYASICLTNTCCNTITYYPHSDSVHMQMGQAPWVYFQNCSTFPTCQSTPLLYQIFLDPSKPLGPYVMFGTTSKMPACFKFVT